MPLPISTVAMQEKNKLASDAVWFVALEIVIPGIAEPVRIVSNNENIAWRAETWIGFRFEIEEIGEGRTGEVPRVELRISNVDRQMEYYIQQYDAYIKANGFSPIEVYIYVLVSKNLGSSTPEAEHLYELKQPKSNPIWATFILGASNPFNKRWPQHRLLKNHCRFIFKGPLCGYSGATAACDKTLTACRNMAGGSNSARYGGTPGVGVGGLRLA
jgi:phage-related protein